MNEDPQLGYPQQNYIPDAFSMFCYKHRDAVMRENPNASMYEINAKLNEIWSNMNEVERQRYKEIPETPQPAPALPKIEQPVFQPSYFGLENKPPPWPLDPQKYLVWLGAQVVQQFISTHKTQAQKPYIPDLNDLNKILEKLKNF